MIGRSSESGGLGEMGEKPRHIHLLLKCARHVEAVEKANALLQRNRNRNQVSSVMMKEMISNFRDLIGMIQ